MLIEGSGSGARAGSGSIPLTGGSGSGRPKNMWILWIQIRIHNNALSCQKYGFGIRDLGSGKNLFRIPDPGVKKAPDPGSRSATLLLMIGTAHIRPCLEQVLLIWFGSCK